MADTVDKQDKVAVKAANTPLLYGHDHALQGAARDVATRRDGPRLTGPLRLHVSL